MRLLAAAACSLLLSGAAAAAEPPLSVGVVIEQECSWKTARGVAIALGSGVGAGDTISLVRGSKTPCHIAVALDGNTVVERKCSAANACLPLRIPRSAGRPGEHSLFQALLHLFQPDPASFIAPIGRGTELHDGTARATDTGVLLDRELAAAARSFQSLRFRRPDDACPDRPAVEEVSTETITGGAVRLAACTAPGLWEVAGVTSVAGRPQITSTAWLLVVPAGGAGDAVLRAMDETRRKTASWPVEPETRRTLMRVQMRALAQSLER